MNQKLAPSYLYSSEKEDYILAHKPVIVAEGIAFAKAVTLLAEKTGEDPEALILALTKFGLNEVNKMSSDKVEELVRKTIKRVDDNLKTFSK